jgi:outer membrane protein OmpA-like peptidoglycan-associated protein
VVIALAGAVALGACSSSKEKVVAPDAADAKPAAGPDVKGAAQKAENENYPNLGDVPKRPPVTPPDQRIIIEEGLLADRANARYTNQPPRWATDTGSTSPAAAVPSAAPDDKVGSAPRRPVAEVPVGGSGTTVASAAGPAMAGAAQVGTIAFAGDSTALPGSSAAVLEHVAAAYKASGGTVRVVGHTAARQLSGDPEQDKLAKLDLSLARANEVAAALVNLGVEQSKIVVAGRADTEPAAPPTDAARAAENARVDVFLEK